MSVVLVSGVTGVGLSSVCAAVRNRLGEEYVLVNFGDAMLEQAVTHDIDVGRDELSSLPRTRIRRLQRRAAEFVADRAADRDVLLSTHLAVETRAGFVHGLPDGVLQEVAPSMFVLVEADPGVILDRRAESDRDLTPVTERHVEFEQHLNRTAAVEYARDLDAPIQFVESEGPVTEAAAEIAETL